MLKISVVIPAYNEELYLPKLLASLQKQTLFDFETIVVDNNSTDATATIAKNFGAVIIAETRQGITYARDTGAQAATGDIIVGVDADCEIPPHYLAKIKKHFEKDASLCLLCSVVSMPGLPFLPNVIVNHMFKKGKKEYKKTKDVPINMCWGQNYAYTKKAFLAIDGFRLDSKLLEKGINTGGTDDFDFVIRMKAYGKVAMDPKLFIITSPRRVKGRFFYWLIVEQIYGFMINYQLAKRLNVVLPAPSYFKRTSPTLFQKNTFRFAYTIVGVISLIMVVTLYNNHSFKQQQLQKSLAYYHKYEKQILATVAKPLITAAPFKSLKEFQLTP